MIHSDWHIHTTASYDAKTPLETLIASAKAQGLVRFGVTDHANFNDEKFMSDLRQSIADVNRLRPLCPDMVQGVELTPIAKPEFDHIIATGGSRDGYEPPIQDAPYDLELAASKEDLIALGVRYAVGASHWRLDVPNWRNEPDDREASIREWYRQQLWLANDSRVTILGHPWYNGKGLWYKDFSVIPKSMHEEIGAALKANGKYAECNVHIFTSEHGTDLFRRQYAEFLRTWFEMGIRITYGSDCHGPEYPDLRENAEKYLREVGFKDGDFSELAEKDLW